MRRTVMIVAMPSRRITVRVVVVAVCAAVLVIGIGWYANRGPSAEVVDDGATSDGWKTIEYEGVRVDIPAAWQRLNRDDCEFEFERWGVAGATNCNGGSAVAFYGSDTADFAHGPGVKRGKYPDEPEWGGYAYAGDWAVYVADDDRAIVQQVLKSAR